MSELQIDILLILVITSSATLFGYFLYTEYQRARHLEYVKRSIAFTDDEFAEILKEKKGDKKAFSEKVSSIMTHAGIRMPMYLFLTLFAAFVLFIGSLFALFLQHWSGFIIGMAFGSLLFYMAIQSIIHTRQKKFNKALAIAISVLVKMMKNGIGFEQALVKSISVSSSPLFKEIFENFFQEKNTIGEVEAFEKINQYIDSKELRIFALAIKIGRASGGQFSNTLEKVEQTIAYREKMQEKVDVITREGSIGSYVVVFITIFLYFALDKNFDGKLSEYFMQSDYGRFQLLGISLWVFLGIMANKFITKVNK